MVRVEVRVTAALHATIIAEPMSNIKYLRHRIAASGT